MHKAFHERSRDVSNRLDSSKFSEILYSNTTPEKSSIYQVKITFKHLRYSRLLVQRQAILIKKHDRTLTRFAKQRAISDLSSFFYTPCIEIILT